LRPTSPSHWVSQAQRELLLRPTSPSRPNVTTSPSSRRPRSFPSRCQVNQPSGPTPHGRAGPPQATGPSTHCHRGPRPPPRRAPRVILPRLARGRSLYLASPLVHHTTRSRTHAHTPNSSSPLSPPNPHLDSKRWWGGGGG